MAKVTIKNHREHDIDLHWKSEKVTVPPATLGPDKKMAPGEAQIDEEMITDLQTNNQAVHGMFEDGWLSLVEKKKPAAKDPAAK